MIRWGAEKHRRNEKIKKSNRKGNHPKLKAVRRQKNPDSAKGFLKGRLVQKRKKKRVVSEVKPLERQNQWKRKPTGRSGCRYENKRNPRRLISDAVKYPFRHNVRKSSQPYEWISRKPFCVFAHGAPY